MKRSTFWFGMMSFTWGYLEGLRGGRRRIARRPPPTLAKIEQVARESWEAGEQACWVPSMDPAVAEARFTKWWEGRVERSLDKLIERAGGW